MSGGHRVRGPLGLDPLHFSATLFGLLLLFVLYLLLPRGVRKQYFGAYPKRHAWSARTKSSSSRLAGGSQGGSLRGGVVGNRSGYAASSIEGSTYAGSSLGPSLNNRHGMDPETGEHYATSSVYPSQQSQYHHPTSHYPQQQQSQYHHSAASSNPQAQQHQMAQAVAGAGQSQQPPLLDLQQNDEIVISAAMQQLRDPGVLIVAHGSRGKPKTVRLQLTESAITWRTETRKKGKDASATAKPKMGKLHQVPLSHIMYVDVGKQTTALRRVENASVSEALCFSLLTKEGSLDLEANSPRERDALVSCFSLVLDEVHAQNWRDIYRGPSSDMPSSFDELDRNDAPGAQATQQQQHHHHHQDKM